MLFYQINRKFHSQNDGNEADLKRISKMCMKQ